MSAIERFIRRVCRDVRFHRLYPATVELVHPDGAMDVTPDDEEIRGMGLSPVRPRPGVPATRASVEKGGRVLLGFEAGDPKRPYIAEFGSGRGAVAFNGGVAGVAGMGDPLEVLFPPVVTITGVVSGQYIQPGPPPTPVPLPPVPLVGGVLTIPPESVTAVVQAGNPQWLV